MYIEKLIEKANHLGMELKRDGGEFEYSIGKKFLEYATALSALQAENEKLLDKIEDARLKGYAKGLGEMSEENERLWAELKQVKRERDAAIEDVLDAAITPCSYCKCNPINGGSCDMDNETHEMYSCWKWSGPQKEG